ncbi:phosphotransferase 1 [Sphaerosporella brunnea]|uniref:2'-phosphotransferase n=1 Tax=Sphaerosporella brunnea TaxID=1250544 RepID=A0A5J5EWK2_9PEZI|nr:phosphotransferase 1 [Sphaerosporella brunnea]
MTDSGTKRRGGGPLTPDVRISKALSYTLRHGAEKEGLKLRSDGYANVSELLAMNKFKSLGLTFPELKRLVAENDKQRYKLIPLSSIDDSDDTLSANVEGGEEDAAKYLIRANQGHSITISSEALELELLVPGSADFPQQIIHGTFYAFYPLIVASGGLKRMGRTHIHLSPLAAYREFNSRADPSGSAPNESDHRRPARGGKNKQQEALSGMRRDAEVVFIIDARRAAEHGGCKFWRSANGVILTEGNADGVLGMDYVERVEDRRGLGVLWEGGKVVKELPVGLKNRMPPRGKEFVVRGSRGGGNAGKGKKPKGKGELEKEEVRIDAGDV